MTRWPWISMVVTVMLVLNPVGWDAIYLATLSSERLSNNIWRPFVVAAVAILIVLGVIEWGVRSVIARRRAVGRGG